MGSIQGARNRASPFDLSIDWVYDEDLEWEAIVRANLYMILGTEYGRHVWRDDPRDLRAFPEVVKIADEVLEEIGDGCLWYDGHPKYLEQLSDDTS